LVRGIRGAVQADDNTQAAIFAATQALLNAIFRRNDLRHEQIASAFLTATTDLDRAFPAYAVRELGGWDLVPLLCAQEMEVPGAMPRVIRVLLRVNTELAQGDVHHVYLGAASRLRPDLASND